MNIIFKSYHASENLIDVQDKNSRSDSAGLRGVCPSEARALAAMPS